MTAARVTPLLALLAAVAFGSGSCATAAGRASATGESARSRAHRLDGPVGRDRQRGLALAHGHAAERRLCERAAQRRRTARCRSMGPDAGRRVRSVRRRGVAPHADARADSLAGRRPARRRDGRRAANPRARLRHAGACRSAVTARAIGSEMGDSAAARPADRGSQAQAVAPPAPAATSRSGRRISRRAGCDATACPTARMPS